MSQEQGKTPDYAFRDFLVDVAQIMETKEPSLWWRKTYRYLRRCEKRIWQYPLEVQQYFWCHIGEVYTVLREEAKRPSLGTVAYQEVIRVIGKISYLLTVDIGRETKPFLVEMVPLEYLLKNRRFRLSGNNFQIFSFSRHSWFNFPLPKNEAIMHKGGFPRAVLKIISGAPAVTIEAELPPNDLDIVTTLSRREAEREAKAMGVDLSGVEIVRSFDFAKIFSDRDTDLNGCLMGKEGLIFSSPAFQAAKSGRIALMGEYSEERALFGSDKFVYDGVTLIKPRGMMRLLKFVAEDKAFSFDFLPLNQQIDLDIYWLVLARKFSRKDNFPELARRTFYLAKKMGQVKNGEALFDILDRVHQQYPFFDMEAADLDETGLARWMGRKLLKQADREFRWLNQIPSNLQLRRFPDDTVPYPVSLIGYNPSSLPEDRLVTQGWPEFLERCRERTAVFNRQRKDFYRIIFPHS